MKTEKENCFKVTKDMLEDAFSEKTKAIILNSPCNPSGMVYSFKELQMIADFAEERDIFIVSDELYEKFIYSGKLAHTSIATLGKNIYNRSKRSLKKLRHDGMESRIQRGGQRDFRRNR